MLAMFLVKKNSFKGQKRGDFFSFFFIEPYLSKTYLFLHCALSQFITFFSKNLYYDLECPQNVSSLICNLCVLRTEYKMRFCPHFLSLSTLFYYYGQSCPVFGVGALPSSFKVVDQDPCTGSRFFYYSRFGIRQGSRKKVLFLVVRALRP